MISTQANCISEVSATISTQASYFKYSVNQNNLKESNKNVSATLKRKCLEQPICINQVLESGPTQVWNHRWERHSGKSLPVMEFVKWLNASKKHRSTWMKVKERFADFWNMIDSGMSFSHNVSLECQNQSCKLGMSTFDFTCIIFGNKSEW